jgi:hypothetical protein
MDFDSIKKGFEYLIIGLGLAIALYFIAIIGGLMVGTLTKTATDGTIPVSTAMNTSLATVEGKFISFNEKIIAQPAVILGLLIIVILAAVFGFKKLGGTGKKGGAMGGMQ